MTSYNDGRAAEVKKCDINLGEEVKCPLMMIREAGQFFFAKICAVIFCYNHTVSVWLVICPTSDVPATTIAYHQGMKWINQFWHEFAHYILLAL